MKTRVKFFLEQEQGDDKEVSLEELKKVYDNLTCSEVQSYSEVLEVSDIDKDGNIHFSISIVSWY